MPTVQVEIVPYYSDNYSYLIHHPESAHTALVDCGDARAIIERLEVKGWGLDAILIAHDHLDHTSGIKALRAEYREALLYTPKKTGFGPSVKVVHDGYKIPFGPMEIEAVSVPFHTLYCTSYYIDNCLFVSDADSKEVLWSFGPGELDFPHMPTLVDGRNVMVFDNGYHRGWSRILVVEPLAKRILWDYRAKPYKKFSSKTRGSNQRLPTATCWCANRTGAARSS